MKVALVHELLTMKGGAERVFKILSEMFPDAPIYTLLYDEEKLGEWFPKERVRTSSLQKYAWLSTNHHWYLPWFPRAVESWRFDPSNPPPFIPPLWGGYPHSHECFDLVISSSSAFAHGIITNGKPKHLCYVNSPARYLWDRYHDILVQHSKGLLGPFKRCAISHLFHRLRIWDAEVADRPDMLLAPSKEVQRRIELYWRRESTVVHPPIDDFWFDNPKPHRVRASPNGSSFDRIPAFAKPTSPRLRGPGATAGRQDDTSGNGASKHHHKNYFLIVSTLVPYKRIELAIDACNQLNFPLKIVGEGPRKYVARLRGTAQSNVEFLGYKDHDELKELYANATATIFPGDEDFGLVPLESMACGTPMIAYHKGGALETVIEEKTGVFFDDSIPLSAILKTFDPAAFNPQTLQTHARQFSRTRFEESIRTAIDAL